MNTAPQSHHEWPDSWKQIIHAYYSYDRSTGIVSRIKKHGQNCKLGAVGKTNSYGYLTFRHKIDGKRRWFSVHRIAYFLATGTQPNEVDHEDGIKTNNRFDNLRAATRKQNSWNVTVKVGADKDLPIGVRRFYRKERPGIIFFEAHLTCDGKKYGCNFRSRSKAIAWRKAKAAELFGEFAPKL